MTEFPFESEPFDLKCWVPQHGTATSLTFQFRHLEAGMEEYAITNITLRRGEKTFESSFATHKSQLREFADFLRQIPSATAAHFSLMDDEYGEMVLCFNVLDPGSGKVTFGGRMIDERWFSIPVSAGRFVAACKTNPRVNVGGVHVVFDGFETDQTYLHQLGTAILWFLNQSTKD